MTDDDTNYWSRLMGDDAHAAEYMATYGEGVGFELRHKLGSLIKENESVLDAGCGPGWNYDHFLEHGPEVRVYIGMDYSERFVRVANERHPGRFMQGDCRKIPAPDRTWDVVILQDVLEHTNGYEKPVREALRVSKRLVIITFWHLTEDDDHINENPEENDYDGWGAWYSQPKWEEFLNTLDTPWKHETLMTGNHKRDIYTLEVA